MRRSKTFVSRRVTASLLCFVALVILPACRTTANPPSAGIDFQGMDRSVAPGDDFYNYANGGWSRVTAIPTDKSAYGIRIVRQDETRLSFAAESARPGTMS
jgi:putative endopeptidase